MKSKTLIKISLICIALGVLVISSKDVNFTSFSIFENVAKEPYKNIEVYFCPAENCSSKLENLIKNSHEIDCAFYDLDMTNLKEELVKKEYRLVTDIDYDPGISHKENKGYQLMHNNIKL